MNDQDMRAVEGMARCGIDFDGLRAAFPKFPIEEIEKIYMRVRKESCLGGNVEQDIKCCGNEAR